MFDGAIKTLCNVKHILDLRKNLISLDTLDYNGFNFKSEGGVLEVSKCVMIIMMKGQRNAKIYILLGTIFVSGEL
jgi:hypothetical protein